MNNRSQNRLARWFGLLALLSSGLAAFAVDLASLCTDRAAIERVYYNHRLGEKPPFEQVLPQATLEDLVRQDLRKEAALRKVYGVEITAALLDAEVQRINTTTRAPDTLAEIKSALNHEPVRFARAMAKPILVERLLRDKFDNDNTIHGLQRRQVEQARHELLAAKTNGADYEKLLALLQRSHPNAVTETTWQLGARPAETNAPIADEIELKKRYGPSAQPLSSPLADGNDHKLYFEALPGELQKVLRVQLRQKGDVSAVIEMPAGFLLYLANTKSAVTLSVATLFIPKASYEQWLNEPSESKS